MKNYLVSAIVEYDYTAKEPDEIDLIKGAIIHNIKIQTGGWWEGTLASNGKTGMFPDNFVRVLDTNDEKSPVILRPKSETVHRKCKVVYSYTQNNEDELTLAVGDIIEFIGVVEEGWWRGKLNDKIGVFPSNFVVPAESSPILANRRTNSTSNSSMKNENRTSLHSSNENLLNSGKVNRIKEKEKDAPLLPPKPIREYCRVLFPYDPQNEDELELQVDDIVTIHTKELPDKGWWRGEIRGKIGVFPDNFVTLLPPEVSPSKDSNSSKCPPPSGGSSAGNSTKVFIKKSGSGSSSQGSSNRKDSFGSRDSLNDILSETGLQTGNVAAQRKSLENKNLDLTNSAAVVVGTSATVSSGAGDASSHSASAAIRKTTRNSMDSSSKSSEVRKSLENIDEKKTPPPVLGKKPIVPVKKSTSVTSVAGNLLSGLKNKVKNVEQKLTSSDTADGVGCSKLSSGSQVADNNEKNVAIERISINNKNDIGGLGGSDFDNVERASILPDMRAGRVKAPKRRPPSAAINIIGESNNNNSVYLNGSGSYPEQYDKNELSPSAMTANAPMQFGDGEELVKPKPREWEKKKAPWMAELKASQEKKKTSPNVEPRAMDRTIRTSESDNRNSVTTEKLDNITTRPISSNVQRRSAESTHTSVTATSNSSSFEIKKETVTNNVVSNHTANDMTKSMSALKTLANQDNDDVKLRPNSLSIRNRSTSPSNRVSINKASSLDVQNVRVSQTTLLSSTSSSSANSQPQAISVSSSNSTPVVVSTTTTTASTTTNNTSLPISHENVCSRVVELEQRISKLETIVQSQNKIIENLVKSLREETDKVKGLKTELDKYAQCVTQV